MRRKLIIGLSAAFIVFMAVLFIYYFQKGDDSRWQVALGGIGVSALPLLLLFAKRIPFNSYLITGYFIAIFCSTYLGSIASFYLKHRWWDTTVHFYKGIYVGFFAIALYKLLVPDQARPSAARSILFLFVISLAVFSSAMWEIYEFVGDMFFTHSMQLGGNKDTMFDLLAGVAGAMIPGFYSLARKEKL